VCKVIGITLNYIASRLVNFVSIRDMILGKGETNVVNVQTEKKFKQKGKGGGTVAIVTETEDKLYRIQFFKRRRLHDNSPFLSDLNRGRPGSGCFYSMPFHEW